jgi:hypothetical protein
MMAVGIALIMSGYSVVYWGIHHFSGVDCPPGEKCRHSLFELLGFPSTWQMIGKPSGQDVVAVTSFNTSNQTQGQSSTNATTGSGLTGSGGSWQSQILTGLNAPVSQNNQNKLAAWNACEGNDTGLSGLGANNPFNTTCDCCGGAPISSNSAGVRMYPTLAAGCQATLNTLKGGTRYAAIVTNLQQDGDAQAFANAVGSSGWGTNGGCIANALSSGVSSK